MIRRPDGAYLTYDDLIKERERIIARIAAMDAKIDAACEATEAALKQVRAMRKRMEKKRGE